MYVLICVDIKRSLCNQSHEHRIFFDTPLHLLVQNFYVGPLLPCLRARRIGKLIHSSHLVLYIIIAKAAF